jgi:hypothetical protein
VSRSAVLLARCRNQFGRQSAHSPRPRAGAFRNDRIVARVHRHPLSVLRQIYGDPQKTERDRNLEEGDCFQSGGAHN